MSGNSGSVFSETLQEITNTKLEELSKKRSEFETAKASIISRLENEPDPLKRLDLLIQGVKDGYGIKAANTSGIILDQSKNWELELELKNLESFMAQSKYDPSITPGLMRSWEESLLHHLDTQSSRLEYASLYAQLVTEWLSTDKAIPGAASQDVDMVGDFEDVADSMKKEARREWERVVFEPAGVDKHTLDTYLADLFGLHDQEKPAKAKALEQLRDKLTEFENTLAAPRQFSPATLTWVINGLLASDLLTDEKRGVLRDFLGNQTILAEVADVLNLRLAAIATWSWGDSVALEQQRKITGLYDVLMHEDVLQAIFLQYIGVKWSVFLKGAFRQFRRFDGAWNSSRRSIPPLDLERRKYYFGPGYASRGNSIHSARHKIYRNHYFMASLMSRDAQKQSAPEGEVEAVFGLSAPVAPRALKAKQASYAFMGSVEVNEEEEAYHERSRYGPAFDAAQESDDSDRDTEDRRLMEDKQRLIRLLSTEIAINTRLHGEVTAFRSVFEDWNSLLPHEAILTVMSLLGVSEAWMVFFGKFLKAPLRFLDDGPGTLPRTRHRGTPASHVLSEVFGESILFCLDFAVNQATDGHNLHRMHDDFWFWSRDHEIAKIAWGAVSAFTQATKTHVDASKSGTVRIARDPSVTLEIDESLPTGDIRWGFLKLSTETGRFEIDQAVVDKHIIDLQRQLAGKRGSIIAFIQTWNTFAATFFTSNFGKPANCFGRAHVDQILATHGRIQSEVFPPLSLLAGEAVQPEEPITSVSGYIKHLLRARFGVSNIPDAYLFFPIELGGLDLRSPFIPILPVREAVAPDPGSVLDDFLEAERDNYERLKLAFGRHAGMAPGGLPSFVRDDPHERERFPAFDEYTRYREDLGYSSPDGGLAGVFQKLLETPSEDGGGIIVASAAVRDGLAPLAGMSVGSSHGRGGITADWHAMDLYWRWVAQLYGPEAIRRFGGLSIVEPGLLPMGMVSIFRDKRVKWQG